MAKRDDASVVRALDSRLAKSEGKKKQVSIGNVREVRKLLCRELYLDWIKGGPMYCAMIRMGADSYSPKKRK